MQLTFGNFLYVFICSPLGIVGSIISLFSVIVLSRIKDSQIFIYFKLQYIFILIDCLIAAILPIFKCKNCFPDFISPSTQCNFDIFLYNFISSIVEMSGQLIEIVTALRFLLIFKTSTTNAPFYSHIFKLNPYLITALCVLLSTTNYIFDLFKQKVGSYSTSNDTTITYECESTDFGTSIVSNALSISEFIISNALLIILLVLINIRIIYKLKKKSQNRVGVQVQGDQSSSRKDADSKLMKLIVADCCNIVIGRMPYIIFTIGYILPISALSSYWFESLVTFTILPIYFSYIVKFFLFYGLNNRFRKEVSDVLFDLKGIFKCF